MPVRAGGPQRRRLQRGEQPQRREEGGEHELQGIYYIDVVWGKEGTYTATGTALVR